MELLLLKSTACLAIFMVFYKLFLEQLSIHTFKRFYLLGAIVASIIIPCITFIEHIAPVYSTTSTATNAIINPAFIPTEAKIEATNYIPYIVWSIYGLGVVLFASKFCINLFGIVSKIKNNEKQKHSHFISVLLNDLIVPHTFFNYIFLNKTKFKSRAIPQEVLWHEQTHARQKHSIDILLLELLQILFWFNPLLYFIKKDIKLNHEFLADQAVLKQGIASSTYQETLLQFTATAETIPLAHAINYSLIKKRFTIMKTKTSRKAIWLRSLLLLPLLGGLLFSFSSTKEVEREITPATNIPEVIANSTPVLILKQEPFSLKLNGKQTSLKNLKTDFIASTHGKKSNLKIEAQGAVDLDFIKNITALVSKDYLLKIKLSEQAYIYDKTDYKQTPKLTVNGITCDGCNLSLSKEGLEKLILATTMQDAILSFKIKFPGYPTESITGDALNQKAINHLNKSNLGNVVTLFHIKTVNKNKLKPVLITLVTKDDKNYSQSPKVKKGAHSVLPPPPNASIQETQTSFITINGKTYYKVTSLGNTKYYNRQGLLVDNKGKILSNEQVDGRKVIPGHYISEVYKDDKVVVEFKKTWADDNIVDKSIQTPVKLEKSLPIPPPIPEDATPEQRKKMQSAIDEFEKKHKRKVHVIKNNETKEIYNVIVNDEEYIVPAPTATIEHVIVKAKEGASFYFNGQPISADKAITIAKNNPKANISTHTNNGQSTVHLSTQSVSITNNGAVRISEDRKRRLKEREDAREAHREQRTKSIETMKDARKEALEERKKMMKSRRAKNQKPLAEQFKGMETSGGEFYFEGDKITEGKAIEIIDNNPKLNVSMVNNNGKSTVHLSAKGIKTVNGKLVKQNKAVKTNDNCLNLTNTINFNKPDTKLTFSCIDQYPKNELKIFNRWGKLVYTKKGYNNSWDGTVDKEFANPKSGKATTGTYYYVLDYDKEKESLNGYLYITNK